MYLLYLRASAPKNQKTSPKGGQLFSFKFCTFAHLSDTNYHGKFFFVKLTGFRDTAAPVLGVSAAGGFAKITLLLITFEDFIMTG